MEESQEKLDTFVTDLRLKLEDRAKSPPAPGRLVAAPRCGHITECSCLLATALLLQYVRRPQHRGRAGVPHLLRAGAAARAAVPRGPHPLQQLQAARGEVPGLQTRVQGDKRHVTRGDVMSCNVFCMKGPDIRNRFIERMSDYYFSLDL